MHLGMADNSTLLKFNQISGWLSMFTLSAASSLINVRLSGEKHTSARTL